MVLTNAKLYDKRVEKKLSRPQLAEFAEVSWETIKAYEVKGATPSLTVALKIAKALDTTVEDLFGTLIEAETVTVDDQLSDITTDETV